MRVDNNLKKTTKFSRITDFFKNRWMRENSPHSEEKSFQPKQFFLDLFLVLLGASISTFVVILTLSIKKIGKSTQDTTTASSIVDKQKINEDSAKKEIVLPTSSIVLFKDIPKNTLKRPLKGKSNLRFETRSAGTLVRVKLLNRLEVLKNAPIFAQIVDYSLGKTLYGKTVLGEASSDNESRKINMSFSKIKFSSKKTVNFKGEALSLDGTLGLLAKRLKGFSTRTALSAS